jgi:hypothetical protein
VAGVIQFLLPLLVLAVPAAAQRPACGFGLGLEELAAAARDLAAGAVAPSLSEGRLAAGAAARALDGATERFGGCGCPDLAAAVGEAAAAAQMAALANDVPMLSAGLAGSGTRLGVAKTLLGRRGCG